MEARETVTLGVFILELQGCATFVNPTAARLLGCRVEELQGKPLHTLLFTPQDEASPSPGEACSLYASFQDGNVHHEEEVFRKKDGSALAVEYTSIPIRNSQGHVTGAVVTFQDITAHKKAQEQIRYHFEQLTALRAIDAAILTNQDLCFTLRVVVDQALTLLGADAADILLLDPTTQTLEYATGRGFLSGKTVRARLQAGEGRVGQIVCEGRPILGLDLRKAEELPLPADIIVEEGFREYDAFPLIARGQVKGVLEVYFCTARSQDQEWICFLETLAGQAAIAIDNANLIHDLQQANLQLMHSYDATIEGWSRTLELRDKETEGHASRVTEVTLRLAEKMGVSATEQVHIRWGALLHDIGKMGVPDNILLKPGPLTEEEWAIMHKHPEYAYELLYPIPFLRQALEIPLCHHEKWDGSGYPHGLRGMQIPLSARIFAVADVWDALRFDRPYRAGWPEEQVRTHIQSCAGSHFDPAVVEAFLQLDL